MKRYRQATRGIRAVIPAIAILLAASCSETAPPDATQAGAGEQPAAAVEAASGAASQPANSNRTPSQNSGVVKTAQTAGAYTYLQVDISGEDFWLATMATAVQPGQKIAWSDYAPMNNFKSKALGREFEQILFVDRVIGEQSASQALQQGVVAESLNAAGYSFIRVDQSGGSIWLAAPETSLSVGQSISWSGGSPMRNFTSRSLDRTFDEILFVGAVHSS